MKLTGTVVKTWPKEEVGEKKFPISQFLLRIDEETEYPQDIPIKQVGKHAGTVNSEHEGYKIDAELNLRGNEWKGKHFLEAQCWKFEVLGKQADPDDEGDGDLPF